MKVYMTKKQGGDIMKKIIFTLVGTVVLLIIGVVGVANNSANEIETLTTDVSKAVLNSSVVVAENDFRIRELNENKILLGDENGDLHLGETLKRQEMVVLISRLMGKEAEAKAWDTSKLTFKDVEKDNWAAGYIAWAKDNNITKGYNEEQFGYDDSLTEIQTAIFLLRVLEYEEAEVDNAYELAKEVGIIDYEKIENNTQFITRGEVGIMIYNALYTYTGEEGVLADKLGIKEIMEYKEKEIAKACIKCGLNYKNYYESNGWNILYIENEYSEIGNVYEIIQQMDIGIIIGNMVIVTNDGKKIETTFYNNTSDIYKIKVDDEIIYIKER